MPSGKGIAAAAVAADAVCVIAAQRSGAIYRAMPAGAQCPKVLGG